MLTKNFKYEEFFVSNEFPELVESMEDACFGELYHLRHTFYLLCKFILQPVRDAIGVPITITSGYRGEELNKAVGGAHSSLHRHGLACDFTVTDKNKLLVIYGFISNQLSDKYGQLILYKNKDGEFRNIHVSLPALGHEQLTTIKEVL